MKKHKVVKDEAKWVAGVGSAVSVVLEDGKTYNAEIAHMGPSPNITVVVSDDVNKEKNKNGDVVEILPSKVTIS